MNRIVIIVALLVSVLCTAIAGALVLGLVADKHLTDRAYGRTEWMVKHEDAHQRPATGTMYYQHEQNEKRKEGITTILLVVVPAFILSGLASLILSVAAVKAIKGVPNQTNGH